MASQTALYCISVILCLVSAGQLQINVTGHHRANPMLRDGPSANARTLHSYPESFQLNG